MPSRTEIRTLAQTLSIIGAVALAATDGVAHANPRPLPFTYQSETLPAGAVEVEQFVDLVPLKAVALSTGAPSTVLTTQFQTEFEAGLTDKLELGLYVSFVPQPGEAYMQYPVLQNGNGFKERLRYRLADPGAWPVDVALYGELTENEREVELEAKIILQRRFGRVRVITNLWAERELYFDGRREWVLNPTLGATAEISPRYHVGAEGWLRSEYPDSGGSPRVFNLGPQAYVGPTFLASFGRLWWSTGVYARVTDTEHTLVPGDAYGHLWVRTIVGLSL